MKGWKQYKLSELYSFGSGLSKSVDEFGYGYPFLSFKVVFDNYFIPDVLTDLVNSTKKEREVCSIKRGDVFFTRTSETAEELGMSSVALKDYPNATFNGFTKRLRPINNIILPEFIGYYFRWNRFRANIISMASETTRASLNNSMLSILPVELPSFSEQRAIAAVLSSLDDKIDLLHRQNATLEAMAEALFRQWFVVEAKDEWEKISLGDLCECITEKFDPNLVDYTTKYIGLEHIDKKRIYISRFGESTEIKSAKFKFCKNDILFGKLRPYFHKVCYAPFDGVCSTDILVIRPKNENLFLFSLVAFYQDEVIEFATYSSNGTRMPRTDWNTLKTYQLSMPNKKIIDKFNHICIPWINKINSNQTQIRTLEKLRDTLLPKLMSGEVRVAIN